jgi:Tol biopolymer transport system component
LQDTPKPNPTNTVPSDARQKTYKIYVVGSDLYSSESTGANPRKIGDARIWSPELSPDTTKLAFRYQESPLSYDRCEFYTMNIDGTNMLPITQGLGCINTSPSWLADNKTLIYSDFKDIYLVNYDGTNLRNLTNSPEDDCCESLSPNKQRVLFKTSLRFRLAPDGNSGYSESILQVMNIDGTNKKAITPDNNSGQYYFFWIDNQRVKYEIPLDGTLDPANAGKFTVAVDQ